MLADAGRDDGRDPSRDVVRQRPRERHEMFDLEDHLKKRGMDYVWVAPTVAGQPNRRFSNFLQAGWTLAEAKDFPEHSGYGVARDQRLIDLGYLKEVRPDGPVDLEGAILLTRPLQMSNQARAEDKAEAERQINDHMNRLRHSSQRAIGDKTQMSRRVTRGAPPPDMVPEDAEIEE